MAIDREFFRGYHKDTRPESEHYRHVVEEVQRSEAYQNPKHPDHALAAEIIRDYYQSLPGADEIIL